MNVSFYKFEKPRFVNIACFSHKIMNCCCSMVLFLHYVCLLSDSEVSPLKTLFSNHLVNFRRPTSPQIITR